MDRVDRPLGWVIVGAWEDQKLTSTGMSWA
jgi:hypothetical protein